MILYSDLNRLLNGDQVDRMSVVNQERARPYWLCFCCWLTLTLCLKDRIAHAAPETRGRMGTVFTLSAGGFMGTGTDGEGERNTSQIGGSFHLMLGEEVLPGLFVGLGLDSYFGSGEGDQASNSSQLFSFGFEGRYRLTTQQSGLVILAGLGIGVGGIVEEGESLSDSDNSGGGSIWKIGLGYELGVPEQEGGLMYIPSLIVQRLGPQMDNQVSLNIISLNLEVLYATGR